MFLFLPIFYLLHPIAKLEYHIAIHEMSDMVMLLQVINDEDVGMHRRHASPSGRERSSQMSFTPQTLASSNLAGYGTSAIVAMDRNSSLTAGTSLSSGLLFSQAKPVGKGTERSLESVLHASQQKVTAIESLLRGLHASDKYNPSLRSSSLDLGIVLTFPSECCFHNIINIYLSSIPVEWLNFLLFFP